MGRRYSKVFCDWIKHHHFDRMPKSTRSVALELNENISAIEAWRTGLTEKQRRRCVHPLSNVRRWRATTAQGTARCSDDAAKAAAAWRRYVALIGKLPPDVALPIWQAVQAQAAAFLKRDLLKTVQPNLG
jgi:hypothetical protein